MKTVSVFRFKRNIKKYFDEVMQSSSAIIVTDSIESEKFVILSKSEYNSLIETGHLLSTAANRKRLNESLNQLKGNNTRKSDLL